MLYGSYSTLFIEIIGFSLPIRVGWSAAMGIWGVQPAVENPMMRGEIPKGTLLKDTYNHWVAKEIYPDKSAVPFSHHDILIVRKSSEASSFSD